MRTLVALLLLALSACTPSMPDASTDASDDIAPVDVPSAADAGVDG